MKTCHGCSTQNPDEAKFCMECGRPMPQEKSCGEESWDESAGGP